MLSVLLSFFFLSSLFFVAAIILLLVLLLKIGYSFCFYYFIILLANDDEKHVSDNVYVNKKTAFFSCACPPSVRKRDSIDATHSQEIPFTFVPKICCSWARLLCA